MKVTIPKAIITKWHILFISRNIVNDVSVSNLRGHSYCGLGLKWYPHNV
jgi:hypothetical protein